ncbi:Peptidyl-tRNA hydrolase 2, mitochondrial [Astathelohania contejeani]|uniref:peptidyl-tRNA hydrolase n=1 Tax=Astathelohania contejeani TaxID=164912 RepID=A0ABQ7I078_9MICR|nr:Peptidyl-tRNA hydrolase 2, mitochondrial [Thelohania contejeani]
MDDAYWLVIITLLIIYIIRSKKKTFKCTKLKCGEAMVLKLIVRSDLKMSTGKIISQVSHALMGVYNFISSRKDVYEAWQNNGQAKIVLKGNIDDFKRIKKLCKENSIFVYSVCDAGRTQVDAGSNTVIAVGPGPKKIIDMITGDLKLY